MVYTIRLQRYRIQKTRVCDKDSINLQSLCITQWKRISAFSRVHRYLLPVLSLPRAIQQNTWVPHVLSLTRSTPVEYMDTSSPQSTPEHFSRIHGYLKSLVSPGALQQSTWILSVLSLPRSTTVEYMDTSRPQSTPEHSRKLN